MLPTTFAEMPNPGKCWLGILSRDSLTSVLTSASFPLYKQGHTPSYIEQPIHFTLSLSLSVLQKADVPNAQAAFAPGQPFLSQLYSQSSSKGMA